MRTPEPGERQYALIMGRSWQPCEELNCLASVHLCKILLSRTGPFLTSKEDTLELVTSVNTFVRARKADGRARRTIEDYWRVLTPFGQWCTEQRVTLQTLDRETVRQYVAELRDNGWSEATVGIHVRNLRAFLRWLYEDGYKQENLARAIRAPRCVVRAEDLLTREEILVLLDACRNDQLAARDRALILTLLDTGLRSGELILLRRSDLRRDGLLDTTWMQIFAPKTSTYRFAFLGGTATSALQLYLEQRHDTMPALWIGVRGPLTQGGVHKALRRRAVQAGLDPARVHPHAFRKMFATHWTENGGDRTRLKALGGWASDAMLDVYVLLASQQKLAEGHRHYGPADGLLSEPGSLSM